MRRGITSSLRSSFVLYLSLALAISCSGQEKRKAADTVDRDNNNLETAKRFLRDYYPEVCGKNLSVTVFDEASLDLPSLIAFGIKLEEHRKDETLLASKPPCRGQSGDNSQLALPWSIGFHFSEKGKIILFSPGPTWLEQRLKEAQAKIDAHPDWSDASIIRYLATEGARFAGMRPKVFLSKASIARLAKYIGTFKVSSVEFVTTDSYAKDLGKPAAQLVWQVRLSTTEGRRSRAYTAVFEPFDGRLISLVGF
jgi:hypothetical protein